MSENRPEFLRANYNSKEISYLKISQEPDDYIEVEGRTIRVVRVSLGGNEEVGHYCKFRGDPGEVMALLEKALWGMRAKFGTEQTSPGQGKS